MQKRAFTFLILQFSFIIVLSNSLLSQGVGYNEKFKINTSTIGFTEAPSLCVLNNGNFIVCWDREMNLQNDWSNTEIFATIYDEKGILKVGEFQVNSYTNDYQIDPRISVFSDSMFVVIWSSYNQDGSNSGIYGQIYKGSGI